MKRLFFPLLCLSLFLLAAPLRAENDFGGWSDPGNADGLNCETSCNVESSTTVNEHENRAGSTSSVDTHHAVTDSEGTKFENNARETKFNDGHREVRDTSVSTTKYGDQTVETSTSTYDQNGNLTDYRHSMDKNRPETAPSPDEGLQTDSASPQEGANSAYGEATYNGDHIKIRNFNDKVDKILDLRNEQSFILYYSIRAYYIGSLYFCMEFGNAILEGYGTPEALYSDVMGPIEQALSQLPPEMAQSMAPARLQMEKGRQEIASIPASLKDLTYEITDRWGLISRHLAQAVLVKNKGRLYQELWISPNIRPLGFLNYKTLPQKAKDYISGIEEPSPQVRGLFSRLVLKRTTFVLDRRVNTSTVRKVRPVKLTGTEFQIPAGFTNKGRIDANTAAQPFKQLTRSREAAGQ